MPGSMHTAEARVAFVVRGVVREALRSAGARGVTLVDDRPKQAALLRRWCPEAFADDVAGENLLLSAANKTELLLARRRPHADLLPLGDLYASELADFAGGYELSEEIAELATSLGGIVALDGALRAFFDERREPADPALRAWLERSRFSRQQPGIVPKLGARTIGIDLFI